MSSWPERYAKGDCVQVWTEMTGLGAGLRGDPDGWRAAQQVAAATMIRVRANVERLLALLQAAGYECQRADEQPVYEPPGTDIRERLDCLEEIVGALPLALRAWYEHVGRINLVGRYPGWRFSYPDPLVVDAPVEYVRSEYETWAQDRGTQWDRGAFTIEISPDYLHKANVSGGAPYALAVPNRAVDGLLLWERHQTTFVNYLRLSFRWAGFPGWDHVGSADWARADEATPEEIAVWAAAMTPL